MTDSTAFISADRTPAGVSDRPCEAEGSAGHVLLTIPLLGEMAMTADAALETAHRLMDAALRAKRHIRSAPMPRSSRAA